MKKIIRYSIISWLLAGTCFSQSVQAQTTTADTTVIELPLNRARQFQPEPLLQVNTNQSVTATADVTGAVLYRTPVANLTNTLYGVLPGLWVKQGSGEPGYDGAALSIRGRGTYDNAGLVIFVDGFQTAASYFAYLSPAEIESIAVLKDPVILSTFGMKGANGVLWITTKRGSAGKRNVEVQVVNGWQQAINIAKPFGSYDYARLYNQAVSNDNYSLNGYQFKWTPQYTDAQLQAWQNGTGTNVDWYDELLTKSGMYTDANINFSGGGKDTRYALIADYMRQSGLYDISTGSTTSNAQIQRFNIRSNLDFKFFKIFEARVDLGGRIEDRRYPNFNGPSLWSNMARYPSNIYPVNDPVTGRWSGTTLFPNNPVASMKALGWTSTHDRTLQANFNLKQRLDFITPGLYLNEAVSFNTWTRNSASKTATYARFNNGTQTTTDKQTDIVANGSRSVDQYDWKQILITAGYDRSFGKHTFSGAVNYLHNSFITDAGINNPGQNTGNNIFYHFLNFGSRLHYVYDARYMLELGMGYSGSDNYAPGNRWGFYPAVAAGWVVSNESFLKNNTTVTNLKLRLSAGQSGNDLTNNGRYLYQQYFISNGTYYTGNTSLTGNGGIIQAYAANPDIFAEKSTKYNAGVDLTLLKKLSLTFDVYRDKRTGIVTQNNDLLAVYGGILPFQNIGEVTNKGYEISAQFKDSKGNLSYTIGAMASYAKNRIDYQAEIPTVNDFNKTTGQPIGTPMGLIADGFYDVGDFNAGGTLKAGLPVPMFGAVQPGDIRYVDIDGNNRIDNTDITRIGDPDYPSFTYAFNTGISYKGFDLTALLQGAAGNSINILTAASNQTVAFVDNSNVFPLAQNAWAYYPDQQIDTRAFATYPRLTTRSNDNNYRNSTFWLKKGNYLRLRHIELGYSLPSLVLQNLHLEKFRIYISGVNLATWSSLSNDYDIDPETNTGYPGLKSMNVGISLTF